MNVLSLFSGIGGIDLGLQRAGMTIVGQVERDPFCLNVLSEHWPEVPRHDEITTALAWWRSQPRPAVDLIAGGFPCADVSDVGRRAGIEGQHSGLWFEYADIIRALRPPYVLVENVPGLLTRGMDRVIGDLARLWYDAEWDCIPAAPFGAPHLRPRIWILAYPMRQRHEATAEWLGWDVPAPITRWPAEPRVGRVADGVPPSVVQPALQALGNAVVPAIAEHVGRIILAREGNMNGTRVDLRGSTVDRHDRGVVHDRSRRSRVPR